MSHGMQKVAKTAGKSRIIIVETTSDVNESNSNDIIVTGSHQGENSGEYLLNCKVKGVIGNDAGKGKQDAGIASLKFLDQHGIPAAAVGTMTAKIGNGNSTYEQGKLSAANETARKLGITVGMSAKDAADKMLEALAK
jgi:uncharacterized protein YunC (DUF1805 family)